MTTFANGGDVANGDIASDVARDVARGHARTLTEANRATRREIVEPLLARFDAIHTRFRALVDAHEDDEGDGADAGRR